MERTTRFRARSNLYFYVPKGTTVIGGYSPSGASDQIRDSTGTVRHTFSTAAEFFSVPVPAGQDGKLWKLHNIPAEKILMTVPPYVARHPNELLLPREVVEADAP
jgi:hypothetical protein